MASTERTREKTNRCTIFIFKIICHIIYVNEKRLKKVAGDINDESE